MTTPTAREALRDLEDQVSALPVIDIAAASGTRWGAACISRELVIALITAARSALQSDAGKDALDAKRYRCAAPMLDGSNDAVAGVRALALGNALMRGLSGEAAIDAAIAVQPDTTKGE